MNRRDTLGTLAFTVLLAAAILGLRAWSSRAAPVPGVFDRSLTLQTAGAKAAAESKVVFALATADWCGPCQSLKRGALTDPQVVRWLAGHTVPVYVDVTGPSAEGERLGVRAVPAMILLRNGREFARAEGALGAPELLRWLEHSTPDR